MRINTERSLRLARQVKQRFGTWQQARAGLAKEKVMTDDLADSCATTSFSTHVPEHLRKYQPMTDNASAPEDNINGTSVREDAYSYTPGTPLPKVSWHPLGGTPPKVTPAGHHAHFDYEVKSWPWLFEPMMAGSKTHDMRDMRDRPYKVGDRMLLREFDPRTGTYTGREGIAMITYITNNATPCAMSSFALDRDFAILSVGCHELGDSDRNA